jgi:hypothetical protein
LTELVKFLATIVAQLVKPFYVAAVQLLHGVGANEGGAVHTAVEGVRLSDDPAVGAPALHYGVREDRFALKPGGYKRRAQHPRVTSTLAGDSTTTKLEWTISTRPSMEV